MELIIWPDLVGPWPEIGPEREMPDQKLEQDLVPPRLAARSAVRFPSSPRSHADPLGRLVRVLGVRAGGSVLQRLGGVVEHVADTVPQD